jgi:hypothetical protein
MNTYARFVGWRTIAQETPELVLVFVGVCKYPPTCPLRNGSPAPADSVVRMDGGQGGLRHPSILPTYKP